ncbi:class I SAM-dependent DNA methyltransferase [Paraliomyxa miuraensis]|uniref:class I SAM-dependent DNA methyltransferase n=1 Tax=Paraliomyxa miuraensis TaxID=376150 RepID=UPI00225A0034|nr:methyltransferase domain-containing protein [Paraliomyxa miuraensis]MCX4239251.1 methyltransferase domain-containing protein [Paraliomyxa miuraensis]
MERTGLLERRDLDVLDAGCGTGLCAPLLRPLARTLVGVDLSGKMLDQARRRGGYDELIEAELTEMLDAHAARYGSGSAPPSPTQGRARAVASRMRIDPAKGRRRQGRAALASRSGPRLGRTQGRARAVASRMRIDPAKGRRRQGRAALASRSGPRLGRTQGRARAVGEPHAHRPREG